MTQISERIKTDKHAQSVVAIVDALQIDFGDKFLRAYNSEEQVRQLKRRLYKSLENFTESDITLGYEKCVKDNPRFVPTIPEIADACQSVKAERLKREKELDKFEEIKNSNESKFQLPAPEVIEKMREHKTTGNLDKALAAHENLIATHKAAGLIKKPMQSEHWCKYPGCNQFGAFSNTSKGGEFWYCREHFRD